MQCHQRNSAFAFIKRVYIAHQCNTFKEHAQRAFTFRHVALYFLYVAYKFGYVIHAHQRIALLILAYQIRLIFNFIHKIFGKIRKRHERALCHQFAHQIHYSLQLLLYLWWQSFPAKRGHKHGLSAFFRGGGKLIYRLIPYSAARHVYYAGKRNVVVRIGYSPEISHNIGYLLALIEPYAAKHLMRYAVIHKRAFYHAALRIGAVQNGKIAVACTLLHALKNLSRYKRGLVALVIGAVTFYRIPAFLRRPKRFGLPA